MFCSAYTDKMEKTCIEISSRVRSYHHNLKKMKIKFINNMFTMDVLLLLNPFTFSKRDHLRSHNHKFQKTWIYTFTK